MSFSKNNKNNLNFYQYRPSRFVVDLAVGKAKNKKKIIAKSTVVLLANSKQDEQNKPAFSHNFAGSINPFLKQVKFYVQRLTIVIFFKAIWRLVRPFLNLILVLAYRVGWLAVFSVRFLWLLFQKIKDLILSVFKRQAQKPKFKFSHLSRALPQKSAVQPTLSWRRPAETKTNKEEQYIIKPPEPWWRSISVFCQQIKYYVTIFLKTVFIPISFLTAKIHFSNTQILKKDFKFWPISLPFFNLKNFYPAARKAFFFGLIVLILILPFKAYTYYQVFGVSLRGQVLGVSEQAVKNIITAGKQAAGFSLDEAQNNFLAASQQFSQAQALLDNINDILFKLAAFAPLPEARLASQGKIFLAAGQKASLLGQELSAAGLSLFSVFNQDQSTSTSSFNFKQGVEHIKLASQLASQLNGLLNQVSMHNLPAEYRQKFALIKDQASKLNIILTQINDLSEWAYEFLGGRSDKRYLVVFQNTAEARATGGFIGSYALVDVSAGHIKSWEAPPGGSYDTAGGLTEFIVAPKPLQLIQARWYFWDANWWPDWPTSAQQLAWFLEKSDGPSVDGVISFTPEVAEKFLAVIGPIKLDQPYNVEIRADNFWPVVQEFAEQKPPQTNKPKKIIGDLLSQILANLKFKLKDKETAVKLGQVIKECLEQKQILIYLSDKGMEQKVKDYGWSGEVLSAPQDYLMVVNTNIGGGKSDRAITQTVEHQTEIKADGTIINTLKITRRHKGSDNPYVNVPNIDWVRVYVPLGSQLIEAGGFLPPDSSQFETPEKDWHINKRLQKEDYESVVHQPSGTKIYTESGKTVFANWSQVAPGQITVIYFKYKLPFKFLSMTCQSNSFWRRLSDIAFGPSPRFYPYSLLVQKQAGGQGFVFNKKITVNKIFDLAWSYSSLKKTDLTSQTMWSTKKILNTDSFFSFLFSPLFLK